MEDAISPRGGALREALVVTATEIIEAEGVAGFTTRALAQRIGVTQPAIYRHFESVEALFGEITRRGLADFDAFATARAGDDEPYGRLARLGGAYVRFAVDHPGWFRLSFGRRGGLVGLAQEREVPAAQAMVLQALARLVDPDDPDFGANYRAWWGLVHGLSFLSIERIFSLVPDDDARVHAAEAAIAVQVEAVRARRGEPGPPSTLSSIALFQRLVPRPEVGSGAKLD
jgi:AcrR family transcriptional regulator